MCMHSHRTRQGQHLIKASLTGIQPELRVNMGVVLNVLVKEGPSGIHFLKKGILTKQGTYIMAIWGQVF